MNITIDELKQLARELRQPELDEIEKISDDAAKLITRYMRIGSIQELEEAYEDIRLLLFRNEQIKNSKFGILNTMGKVATDDLTASEGRFVDRAGEERPKRKKYRPIPRKVVKKIHSRSKKNYSNTESRIKHKSKKRTSRNVVLPLHD